MKGGGECQVRTLPAGGQWGEVTSAGSHSPGVYSQREGKSWKGKAKEMKITAPPCLRLKAPDQEYLSFFWEVGLFLSSGEPNVAAGVPPVCRVESQICGQLFVDRGPGSCCYCSAHPELRFMVPPCFPFSPPASEGCFALLYVSL